MTYKNKIVLLSGASSGIGEALALALGQRGAKLVLVARRKELLKNVAKRSQAECLILPADLSKPQAARQVVAKALKKFKRLDILINNAGMLQKDSVEALPAERLRRHFEVNYFSAYSATQAALPALRASKGSVVFTSSPMGKRTASRMAAYCGSKAALEALADALRIEEAPHGVHVMTLRPDLTATPMASRSLRKTVQTAGQVAELCLRGISRRASYVWCTQRSWLYGQIANLAPNLVDRIMIRLEKQGRLH